MEVEIPEGLINQEIHRMVDRFKESIEKQGVNFEQYLQSVKKTHDDLHKDYQKQAKSNIEVGFLLGEIIKREKLDSNDKQAPAKALDILKKYAIRDNEQNFKVTKAKAKV
jgi:trigger factor